MLKTRQNDCAEHARVGNGMASMYAFDCQRERLQGHVAYELQSLHHGNVKVIYYRQSVSNLLRAYGMASARSPFDI